MKKATPLRRYLSVRTGLAAALPILIVAGLAWKFVIPQMTASTGMHHQSAARAIAGQISAHLAGGERQLVSLAQYLQTGLPGNGRADALLDAQCGDGELFEAIYLTTGSRQTIGQLGLARGSRLKRTDLLGLDLSGRDFLVSGGAAPSWSETFLSTASARLAVALMVAVGEEVIIGEITLDRLSEVISQLPEQGRFVTLVLDRNGRIIADSQKERWGQYLDLSTLDSSVAPDTGSFFSANFDFNGQRMLGTLVRVDSLGWSVLVAQPSRTAYKTLTAMFIMLLTGLGVALVLALVIAWIQADGISRHIGVFIRLAQGIAQGEYGLTIPSSKTEELTSLGKNLTLMAGLIKQRETALTESEMQLAITLDSIGDAVIATDTLGRITRMNPTAEHLTGWLKEEALGRVFSEVFSIYDTLEGKPVPPFVRDVIARGEIKALSSPVILKNREGRYCQVSSLCAPIRQVDGRIVGAVLVLRDVTDIYEKERQIRENEKRLKHITENIPEAVFQMEMEQDRAHLSHISPKAREIFGIAADADTFLAEFLACLSQEDQVRFRSSLVQAAEETDPWSYEGQFVKPDGDLVWFAGKAGVQRTQDTVIFNGVLTDLTQRHNMEHTLKITQFSVDNAAIGIFYVDQEAVIRFVNTMGAGQLGYRVEEVVNQPLSMIDPDVNPESWKAIRGRLTRDGFRQFERVHRKKNGERINVQVTSNLIEYDGAKFSISFAQDITAQKESRVELDRLNAYLANVFDSMPSALIGVDMDQKITRWNTSVAELTGVSLAAAAGKPVSSVFPRLASHREIIAKSLATRKVERSVKASYDTGMGETRYEDITIYPLTGSGIDGAVIRIDDVTQKVRLEEALIQNEKMLSVGGLAAGMAHEINNPLAGVIQNASVLANRLNSRSIPANVKAAEKAGITMAAIAQYMEERDVPRMLKSIIDAGLRMAGIVENMLSFARKGDSSFSSYDPAELMDKALALAATDYDLKKHYDFRSIEICREYEANLPMIACEGTKIQQVLLNILNNGAHAMLDQRVDRADAPSPRFILRLHQDRDAGMLRMEIQDNGSGMDETTRRKVFEPFFTTKPTGSGTGLGLSVSYFIIKENHKGDMEVVSEPGQGTNFIISLPLAETAA